MNERDYITLEIICLLIGIIGMFLSIFYHLIYNIPLYSMSFGITFFLSLLFFFISIYWHYKRQIYIFEMLEELKKYER